MTLNEWIERDGRGAITRLHHSTLLAVNTITDAARDGAKTRRVAELLSDATGGDVTVATLLGFGA